MKRLHVLAATALFLSIGCGGVAPMAKTAGRMAEADADATPRAAAANEKGQPPEEAKDAKPRKIIYNANATLVVDDFDQAEAQLKKVIDSHKGSYIAKADLNVSPNSRRMGTWTIRVPAEQRESFMEEIAKIGEVHQSTLDSKDITDEYYDLENRIKNKQARQEALRELLKKKTDKVEELLAVDRELAKVTEDIEVAQAQMQRWKKLSDFATVVLTIQDRRDYIPPPPTSPTFGTTVARNWQGSLDALAGFGKALVVVIVVLVPWPPLIALVVVPPYLVLRRALRSTHRPAAAPLEVLPATPPPVATA
jgi:hypothetical protein